MHKKLSVSIVIPSWNSESQLEKNLPFVFVAAHKVNAEIVIVDDDSQHDNSGKFLKSLGNKIRFYTNKANGGYSESVNLGVKMAKGDLIMLLNTDVRPSPDCFFQALKYFEDEAVYAVGFNSLEGWMGGEWKSGLFHHFKVDSGENNTKTKSSLWASGGQAAFSRIKWLELGGMDLLYKPFYWEDTDMGYNAWKRGWKVLWGSDCHCVHDHQKSVITNNFTKEYIFSTAQRNQFLFVWKNISDPFLLISHLIRLPYFMVKYPRPLLSALRRLPILLQSRSKSRPYWKVSDHEILTRWKVLA